MRGARALLLLAGSATEAAAAAAKTELMAAPPPLPPPRPDAPASSALRVRSWSKHTYHHAIGDTWPCTSLASGGQLCVAGDITLASPNGSVGASCPGSHGRLPLHDSGMSAWRVQGTPDADPSPSTGGYSGLSSMERVSGYCDFSPERFCRGTAAAQTKPSAPIELNGTLFLGVSCITYGCCGELSKGNPDNPGFQRQLNIEGYI